MALSKADLELSLGILLDDQPLSAAKSLAQAPSSIWIASGLAKGAAMYGATLTQRLCGRPSRMMTALEFCHSDQLSCLPVLVTLRGRNIDAVDVSTSIVARNAKNALVVTGDKHGVASTLLRESSVDTSFINSELPDEDKRFINFRGLIFLSALCYRLAIAALTSPPERLSRSALMEMFLSTELRARAVVSEILEIENWRERQLIILTTGLASDLAITWQSILAEAGVLTSACRDIKDYTHGDHAAAVRAGNCMFLVISYPEIRSICDIFSTRFKSLYPVFTIDLQTDIMHRYWDNLFFCYDVVDGLTSELGYPGQRPPRHPVVWSWRGWGSILPIK